MVARVGFVALPVLVVGCLLEAASATTLSLTITDELLPQRSATTQKITLEGLPGDCSTTGVTSLELIYEGNILEYSFVAEESAALWAGTEEVDLLGHARLTAMKIAPTAIEQDNNIYYSLADLEPSTTVGRETLPCLVNAHISSSAILASFVIGTFADGTVWADAIDTVQESSINEIEVEYGPTPPTEDGLTEADDGSVIQMNVPYTSEALCAEAGLTFPCDFSQTASVIAKINYLIAETNTILTAWGDALHFFFIFTWST